MDTDLLKTFLEVSRTRHFGKAAENLFLTRSAVSFRVKQLESLLGVELFERQRNNIHPTPSGERMLTHAEAVLNAWERAKQDILLSAEKSVQLTIGAAPNIWDAYLKPHMQGLHQHLEGVVLRTEVLPQNILVKQLLERVLDIAISFEPPAMDEFTLVQVKEVELLLVSAAKEPITDIAEVTQYVKVDWGTAFNIKHANKYSQLPLPVLHTGTAQIGLDFIMNNQGCAFLPDYMVKPLIADGSLQLVAGRQSIRRSVYVAYLEQNDRLSEIEAAIHLLKKSKL